MKLNKVCLSGSENENSAAHQTSETNSPNYLLQTAAVPGNQRDTTPRSQTQSTPVKRSARQRTSNKAE
jgi:hypothetical protein